MVTLPLMVNQYKLTIMRILEAKWEQCKDERLNKSFNQIFSIQQNVNMTG
jgi:hypothetical protein